MVCFQVFSHTKKGNEEWLLHKTTEIKWSDCNTHLLTFRDAESDERDGPLEVNAEALEAMLPQLEKVEKEQKHKEETLKKQEQEKRKMGPPEDMMVHFLKRSPWRHEHHP